MGTEHSSASFGCNSLLSHNTLWDFRFNPASLSSNPSIRKINKGLATMAGFGVCYTISIHEPWLLIQAFSCGGMNVNQDSRRLPEIETMAHAVSH